MDWFLWLFVICALLILKKFAFIELETSIGSLVQLSARGVEDVDLTT